MIFNTHLIISDALLKNIEDSKTFFISEKNFKYGNIKPDLTSKYLFHKHYLEESFEMIVSKIKELCKLSLDFIEKHFSIARFSQEIGVICHFLCDFFCLAHSERWEFSHSFKKHVTYENELQRVAKETNFSLLERSDVGKIGVEDFFYKLYKEYKQNEDFRNDLLFSTYMCNSVLNYIFDCILDNTVSSYTVKICG